MKNLSREEVRELARVVLATVPDELTCDEWLDHAAGYAERMAAGDPIPEALRGLAQHLQVCPECVEELRICLLALVAEAEERHLSDEPRE